MLETMLKSRSEIYDKKVLGNLEGKYYSYSELDQWSNRVAGYLRHKGVRQGDRIVSMVPSSPFHVVLFFAALKVGGILVPINPYLNKDLISRMIDNIEPSLIIDDYGNRGESSGEAYNYSGEPYNGPYREDDERPGMILFTGGTTGDPKGAIISVRSILWNAIITAISWNLSESDSTIVSLPLYHTGGWNVLLMPMLLVGGRIIISHEKFDPEETVKALSDLKISIYMGVPTMLSAMSRTRAFALNDLSNTRFISGGGSLPPATFEEFRTRGLKITQGYGLTEAGPNNFNMNPETYPGKPGSVGKPNVFIEMKLKEDGELAIRGPHVFSGYWKNKEEKPFDSNGYLLTGDIFRIDEEGYYFFIDRKKNMIKTGGENVYASEIEEILSSFPGVIDNCVVGVPDDYWGEIVVAFVVCHDKDLDENSLKAFLRSKLAGFKIPKKIIFMGEIPKSEIGKPLRKELIETYEKNIH